MYRPPGTQTGGNPYANGGMAGQNDARYVGLGGGSSGGYVPVQGGTYSPLMQGTRTSYRKSADGSSTPVEYGYYPGQPKPPQGGQGGSGQQPGGGGFPGVGGGDGQPGGGHYGGGGGGGTTPPGGTPGTSTGPLFSKADTDRAVSQAAANAFGAADAYTLKTAASGNGLSYGAGQAGVINPLISQAGVNARTAAKTIPLGDALANENWMLGGQAQRAQNALDWARLGEYRNQTNQMGDDYFTKLLMALL